MDEKQLQKLIRKNSENAEKARKRQPARKYDPTLPAEGGDDDLERKDFFDEMKRREF